MKHQGIIVRFLSRLILPVFWRRMGTCNNQEQDGEYKECMKSVSIHWNVGKNMVNEPSRKYKEFA